MENSRGMIAALVVIALVLLGGIWLVRHMQADALLQDCAASGRMNCVPAR